MARAKEPKYRILAYDGDYKSRDLLAAYSGGHRLQRGEDKKGDALKVAEEWMSKYPPQEASRDRRPYVEISSRGYREALWEPLGGVWVEKINHLRSKSRKKNPGLGYSISPEEFDALRTGQRVWMTVASAMSVSYGEMEFEVGKATYSKKYDVHNKRLYPVRDGKPQKMGAKWTLRKRASGSVSLAHGDMGTLIRSYRTNRKNPQVGPAGKEAGWFGRVLGHQKWPDSDYPYDVPGQVTGKHRGYLFRVYQRPRGVGFVKEVWDWKDRHHYVLPYASTKAQAVHEVKQRIDEYVAESNPKKAAKKKVKKRSKTTKRTKNPSLRSIMSKATR